jgi:hypothetical protein
MGRLFRISTTVVELGLGKGIPALFGGQEALGLVGLACDMDGAAQTGLEGSRDEAGPSQATPAHRAYLRRRRIIVLRRDMV